jgi:transcriptional regulator of nitric oxide reductase
MFEELNRMKSELQDLSRSTVQIKAVGKYPVKAATKVADVAVYQNDGTEKITPAKFVERAESQAAGWSEEIDDAVCKSLDGDEAALQVLGTQIAADIGDMCDRIKTGRLKASFRPDVKK